MAEAASRIRKLEDLTEADIQRMDELSEQMRPPPAEILLDVLRRMESVGTAEYAELSMVTVYEHSLQAATRACNDGEDEETTTPSPVAYMRPRAYIAFAFPALASASVFSNRRTRAASLTALFSS